MNKKTTVLCILDGYGLRDEVKGNAIKGAKKPHIDKIFSEYNMVKGNASGTFVGLPDKQMGNSEVGHLNIGAGRIVYQDLTRISKSIDDGDFFKNPSLLAAINHVEENNSTLHLMGLLSNGGVHTHNSHLYALLSLAKKNNISNVMVHCFMDGRDTSPNSGINFIKELDSEIKKIGVGKIASVCGRYYAMDRDKNYDRVKVAYDMLANGTALKLDNVYDALNDNYKIGTTDEFIKPIIFPSFTNIKNNDAIIFYNFRPDRARQITHAFCDDDFTFFDRKKIENLVYVCMTEYDPNIKNKLVAFDEKEIKNHIGEYISNLGLKQLRTAETEKYAHVTFFFNGGKEVELLGEDRLLVSSPKDVPTYDLKPEMSADAVCENVLNGIDSDKYDLIVVNFANPDMVGHTGNYDAAVLAIEKVDECVGKIYDKINKKDDNLFIIADHGNAEVMLDDEGNPYTAHTNNPVPFCLITPEHKKIKENGALCDVAPTLLELMGLDKPIEMTGNSLIIN